MDTDDDINRNINDGDKTNSNAAMCIFCDESALKTLAVWVSYVWAFQIVPELKELVMFPVSVNIFFSCSKYFFFTILYSFVLF